MKVDLEELLAGIAHDCPFAGYVERQYSRYASLAKLVAANVPRGSKVLDFGSGVGDKAVLLARLGYDVTAYDDLSDNWHREGDNRELIRSFAARNRVAFTQGDGASIPYPHESFDLVMLNDILEHFHSSPRLLLNEIIQTIKVGGLLLVAVPNAANVRKRLAVLTGRTNYPPYSHYYWCSGIWRGHVREYTKGDLQLLSSYLSLDAVRISGADHMLEKVPRPLWAPYRAITTLLPSLCDSWILLGRRPAEWTPRSQPELHLVPGLTPWSF